jgi:hypothetical protein
LHFSPPDAKPFLCLQNLNFKLLKFIKNTYNQSTK